jgi:methylthioribose-1-phosphate isomerase
MKVDNRNMRPIWADPDDETSVSVIDQRRLPHELTVLSLKTVDQTIYAIKEMVVRGAPLIGATGAFGVFLAALTSGRESVVHLEKECLRLKDARPTAVNLAWAVDRVFDTVKTIESPEERIKASKKLAEEITEEEAENCRKIGEFGLSIIRGLHGKKKDKPVNILTHCNAGWLACVDYGTATAPMYAAHDAGIPIHVWVDETRPLNQGARLTAWELGKHGVPHTVITDNAGGHLMQHGMVDLVITGTDRTTYTGDVANKIGTYLKALAARDNNIPFYVALPSSTFDWTMKDGIADIPIEVRNPDEVSRVQGLADGEIVSVLLPPSDSPCANYAFDVTPARLVTGFITERGICPASEDGVLSLFPEKK